MDNIADCTAHYLPIQNTGYFSSLIKDYLEAAPALRPYYVFAPDDEGMKEAIRSRAAYPVDRNALTAVLREQYAHLEVNDAVARNIELLEQDNTYTICTAHQPNLMSGYLYFIYKIIHAAKLARHLSAQHAESNFVPVFYIGSEDNDLDELSIFRYEGKSYRWNTTQTGAVGSMHTEDLQELIADLFRVLGPMGVEEQELKRIILTAYGGGHTIAQATRILVNELLGFLGIVVLDANDARLKKAFIPVMKEELLQHTAQQVVTQTSESLNEAYTAQAFVRPINLFYMKEGLRERIERKDDQWFVLNTDVVFDEAQLMQEVEQHPERFSPNVILRGMYQETILPDVAFIGGGSEVAYWMQMKDLFAHYKAFFPTIVLRQSAMIIGPKSLAMQQKLNLSLEELFLKTEPLIDNYVAQYGDDSWNVNALQQQVETLEQDTIDQLADLDGQLHLSAEAVFTKIKKQVEVLEKKVRKAAKRKMADRVQQIQQLKEHTFPKDSLQERYDTFMPFYLQYGQSFFEALYEHTDPYGKEFLVLAYNR